MIHLAEMDIKIKITKQKQFPQLIFQKGSSSNPKLNDNA